MPLLFDLDSRVFTSVSALVFPLASLMCPGLMTTAGDSPAPSFGNGIILEVIFADPGNPESSRPEADREFVSVNGRPVSLLPLRRTIRRHIRALAPDPCRLASKYPSMTRLRPACDLPATHPMASAVWMALITVPPSDVDISASADKMDPLFKLGLDQLFVDAVPALLVSQTENDNSGTSSSIPSARLLPSAEPPPPADLLSAPGLSTVSLDPGCSVTASASVTALCEAKGETLTWPVSSPRTYATHTHPLSVLSAPSSAGTCFGMTQNDTSRYTSQQPDLPVAPLADNSSADSSFPPEVNCGPLSGLEQNLGESAVGSDQSAPRQMGTESGNLWPVVDGQSEFFYQQKNTQKTSTAVPALPSASSHGNAWHAADSNSLSTRTESALSQLKLPQHQPPLNKNTTSITSVGDVLGFFRKCREAAAPTLPVPATPGT
eukprot:gene1058-2634_t